MDSPEGSDLTADAGLARPLEQARSNRSAYLADWIAVIVLALLQVGGAVVSWLSIFAIAMSTDPCAYQDCGDPGWIWRALWTVLAGNIAAVALSLVGFIQLARKRTAFWAPLAGLVIQLSLLALGWWLATKAGPLK
ncbi:hypothetical protein ABIA30_000848 [Mycobacterium sp. MAA66]|uniref:hypothetical protein n=1 Tax=Mycobacterium sp. MAA66 TaxID=3156297 RepID=UPI0035194E69